METAVGRSKINMRQGMRPDLDVSTSEAVTFARYLPGIHAIREPAAAPRLRRRFNYLAFEAIGHCIKSPLRPGLD